MFGGGGQVDPGSREEVIDSDYRLKDGEHASDVAIRWSVRPYTFPEESMPGEPKLNVQNHARECEFCHYKQDIAWSLPPITMREIVRGISDFPLN
ncbi:MAG: hypothetical protein HYT09_03640 [Candidatus Levybacteria bacterium]|nr:hypothetical protein [Candidatus Levybacteria bacterium]